MTKLTDIQLIELSDVIKDEQISGANTALRVGLMFENIIDNKINVKYFTGYTATTAPTTYLSKSAFNIYSGITQGYIQSQKNVVILSILTTTPFTATSATHYIHCSGTSAISIFLPTSPKLNQIIVIADAKGNAGANNITINGNGKKINGLTTILISSNYGSISFVYNGVNWFGKP